jgi:hypothetical protein
MPDLLLPGLPAPPISLLSVSNPGSTFQTKKSD